MRKLFSGLFAIGAGAVALLFVVMLLFDADLVFSQSSQYRIDVPLADVNIRNAPANFTTSAAVGGVSNETRITYTALDKSGNRIPYAVFDIWLSDSSAGLGLTATTASGSVGTYAASGNGSGTCDLASIAGSTPSTTSGACLATATSKKALRVQANSSGQYVLQVVDSAKTLFYPVAYSILAGVKVGTRLTTGNYL